MALNTPQKSAEDVLLDSLTGNNFPEVFNLLEAGVFNGETEALLARFTKQYGNPRIYTSDPVIDLHLKNEHGVLDPRDPRNAHFPPGNASISDLLYLEIGNRPHFNVEKMLSLIQPDSLLNYKPSATVTPTSLFPTRYNALYPTLTPSEHPERKVTLAVIENGDTDHAVRVMDQSVAFRQALDPNHDGDSGKIIGIREALYNGDIPLTVHRQLMFSHPSVAENIIYNFSMAEIDKETSERLDRFKKDYAPIGSSHVLEYYLRKANPIIFYANGNKESDPLYDQNPYIHLPRSYGVAAGQLDGAGTMYLEGYNERYPFITMPIARSRGTSFSTPAASGSVAEFTEHYGQSLDYPQGLTHEEIMFVVAATAKKDIHQVLSDKVTGEAPIFYNDQPSGLSYSSTTGFGTIDVRAAEKTMKEMIDLKAELIAKGASPAILSDVELKVIGLNPVITPDNPEKDPAYKYHYAARIPEGMTMHHFNAVMNFKTRGGTSPEILIQPVTSISAYDQKLRIDADGAVASHYLIGTTLQKGDTILVSTQAELSDGSRLEVYTTPPDGPIPMMRDKMLERGDLVRRAYPELFLPEVPVPTIQQKHTDLSPEALNALAAAECIKQHLCEDSPSNPPLMPLKSPERHK